MKQSQDPFEAAFVEQEESPPESPAAANDIETQIVSVSVNDTNQTEEEVGMDVEADPNVPSTSAAPPSSARTLQPINKNKDKEEDEEEDEDNMDVELSKLQATGDPDKMAKMQAILSQFTEEQMSRYESFRRSGFQKSNMKRLLVSVTGSQKISVPMTIVVSGIAKMFVGELVETGYPDPTRYISDTRNPGTMYEMVGSWATFFMTIVVSGIAKMFVGELVETAKTVMAERKDSGAIRPCHIRESYRRLKLEGKVPKRSAPRLFH